jgi:hypothetical protein
MSTDQFERKLLEYGFIRHPLKDMAEYFDFTIKKKTEDIRFQELMSQANCDYNFNISSKHFNSIDEIEEWILISLRKYLRQ